MAAMRADRGQNLRPDTSRRGPGRTRWIGWSSGPGLSVLDAGCGNGAKIAQLVQDGSVASVGVDISDNFVAESPGLELVQGDLSDLSAVPALAGRRFDRILFLQSFGYAKDPVHARKASRGMLTDDGFVLLTRTQPIR